jgi:hypothetical protein
MIELKAFKGEVVLLQMVQPMILATGASGGLSAAAIEGPQGKVPMHTGYMVGEIGVDEERGAFIYYPDPGDPNNAPRCKAYIGDENVAFVSLASAFMAQSPAPSGIIMP